LSPTEEQFCVNPFPNSWRQSRNPTLSFWILEKVDWLSLAVSSAPKSSHSHPFPRVKTPINETHLDHKNKAFRKGGRRFIVDWIECLLWRIVLLSRFLPHFPFSFPTTTFSFPISSWWLYSQFRREGVQTYFLKNIPPNISALSNLFKWKCEINKRRKFSLDSLSSSHVPWFS
jgi:hypothetical protein